MSPADDRWSRGARGHWFQAVLCVAATLGLIGLFFVPAVAPAMLKLEHWTADWRTAWLSDRRATAHPDLAIVTIDLAALEPYPFLLPISRSLQADIVDILARSGVRAIALDFYYMGSEIAVGTVIAHRPPHRSVLAEERGELLRLPVSCSLPYAFERLSASIPFPAPTRRTAARGCRAACPAPRRH